MAKKHLLLFIFVVLVALALAGGYALYKHHRSKPKKSHHFAKDAGKAALNVAPLLLL